MATGKELGQEPACAGVDAAGFHFQGRTKREWLAGICAEGILANPDNNKRYNSEGVAFNALKVADELLDQIAKTS